MIATMKVIRYDPVTKKPREIDTDAVEREHGLQCGACGCRHFRTIKTLNVGDHVRRVRVCRHCGKRARTIERAMVAGEPPPQSIP